MSTKLDNISEETRDELAALALRLSNNQATRKGFLGLVKTAAPETPIPELDVDAQIQAALSKEREARENIQKEFSDFKLNNDLAAKKQSVREQFGLSDEDMSKMETMMQEQKLPADYTWAAKLYKAETTPTEPTNYGSSGYGPFDLTRNAQAKEFEGLLDDTDNWASRTAHSMIDEMRRGRAPTF